MTDENGIRRKVKASYGIVNVLRLRHVSALKHRYPSIEFTSITVPKGRREQGTPRLGEGELASMMMQNMMSSVEDSIMTSDLCYVSICPGCCRLVINCDCNEISSKA